MAAENYLGGRWQAGTSADTALIDLVLSLDTPKSIMETSIKVLA